MRRFTAADAVTAAARGLSLGSRGRSAERTSTYDRGRRLTQFRASSSVDTPRSAVKTWLPDKARRSSFTFVPYSRLAREAAARGAGSGRG